MLPEHKLDIVEERRVNNLETLMLIQDTIRETVAQIAIEHPLSQDEIVWVKLAIKAEADRAAFRKAVIDKTLTSLIVAALGAVGLYCLDYFTAHWIK
jgi:hypothetical protein